MLSPVSDAPTLEPTAILVPHYYQIQGIAYYKNRRRREVISEIAHYDEHTFFVSQNGMNGRSLGSAVAGAVGAGSRRNTPEPRSVTRVENSCMQLVNPVKE